MKQTTMCIISGFFGAVFAVACGAIDGNNGVGGKDVYADDVMLTKSVYEVDCADAEEHTVELDNGTSSSYLTVDIGRTVSTNASVTSWYSVDGNDLWMINTTMNVSSEGWIMCLDNRKFQVVIIE